MSRIKMISIMMVVLLFAFAVPVWGEEENRELILDTQAGKTFRYKTDSVKKGDLVLQGFFQANVVYPNSEKIYYTVKKGKGIFQEYLVKEGEYVEAGTPLVSLKSTVTKAQVEEQELKLFRAQEDYNDYLKKYNEFLDEEAYRTKVAPGYQTENLAVLKSKQKNLEYTYQLSVLSREVTKLTKEFKEYKDAYTTTQIVAPSAGIIGRLADFKTGKEMDSGCYITELSQTDKVYLSVTDKDSVLHYGMKVEVTIGQDEKKYPGHVITPHNLILHDSLATTKSYIVLDEDNIQLEKKSKVMVFCEYLNLENVLLVKTDAITEDRKGFFVNKLVDDRLVKTYIIVGQKNLENAYVLEGLQEGDIVVRE